jgi:hypothetical protein
LEELALTKALTVTRAGDSARASAVTADEMKRALRGAASGRSPGEACALFLAIGALRSTPAGLLLGTLGTLGTLPKGVPGDAGYVASECRRPITLLNSDYRLAPTGVRVLALRLEPVQLCRPLTCETSRWARTCS